MDRIVRWTSHTRGRYAGWPVEVEITSIRILSEY